MKKKKGTIIAHGGSAHFDDLFATALVIYKCSVDQSLPEINKVYRREPSEEERKDPDIWKLDVGRSFNPKLKLFDHHPPLTKEGELMPEHNDLTEECTFSLLLKTWGIWEKAIRVYDFLQIARIMDAKGPNKVAKYLNISNKALDSLQSFIEESILHLFEKRELITHGEPLFNLLRYIGNDFFKRLKDYYDTLAQVEEKAKFKKIKQVNVIECFKDIKLTRSLHPILDEKKKLEWGKGGISVYPNERPPGSITLRRYDDDERIDFRRIKSQDKVIFVHHNGFLAVVEGNTIEAEIEELIKLAII
ncbi:MAG: hypothetical protein GF383_12825 [Candidatus Lokiarchaeota archaeon]|nr:hypothetical protein [Candidatus Lokiarchaeota archaeon]MBD3341971.1 hypothetical protein [Candidatus Lokiarchaeota archaeon]